MVAISVMPRARMWPWPTPEPWSSSDGATSDGEGGATTARGLHVGVVELEARALEALDVIDLRTDEVHQAHLVDHDLDAGDLERAIDLGDLVEVEVVGEPG